MRPFTDVLRDHRNGKLVEHLTERLAELVAKVQETGKAGEITLKLKVGFGKGDEDALEVTPNVSVKLPEKDLPKSLFFVDDSNNLVREPPRGALFSADEVESDRADRRRSS